MLNLDKWTVLKNEHFALLASFIKSATDRGIYYKDQRLIQCFKKYVNSRQCLFKIENDTLLLARHFKYINNRIFKLMIPPIHLHGDVNVELEALRQCLSNGISSNVTKEYAQKHKLKYATLSQYVGAREIMYERGMDLSGKKFKKQRNERNKFINRISRGETELVLDHPYENLRELNEIWSSQKGKDYGEYGYVIKNIEVFKDHVRNLTLLCNGTPIVSQLYICFNDHTWYCSSAISDFENPYSHGVQRQMDISIFDYVQGLQRVLIGGWTEDGLRRSKLSIPHTLLTKVRAKPFVKLEDEYWMKIEELKGKKAGKKPKTPKTERAMKDWQNGYELDYLISLENDFKKYNDLCISPFLEMKKNRVAEHLHKGVLVFNDDFRCVVKPTKVKSNIKVYSSRSTPLAYKEVGDIEISKLTIDNLKGFKDYCDSLSENVWVLTFDNEEENLDHCGFKKVGYKYTSFGDSLGVYFLQKQVDFFGTNQDRLLYTDPLDRATCVNLSHHYDVSTIEQKIQTYDFKKHYSNYNKGGGWSAISLRGFSDDPSFIIKPEEMNDKWKEKHKEEDFSLRDTEAYDHFNEVRGIIKRFAPTQEIERVRIMKLSKGAEIAKHTDLVDPDCGVKCGSTMRFHVPIITKDSKFEVWGQDGKESFFLDTGSLWYLDTRKPHRVINPTQDRYHLVFDVFVDNEIQEKVKQCL